MCKGYMHVRTRLTAGALYNNRHGSFGHVSAESSVFEEAGVWGYHAPLYVWPVMRRRTAAGRCADWQLKLWDQETTALSLPGG